MRPAPCMHRIRKGVLQAGTAAVPVNAAYQIAGRTGQDWGARGGSRSVLAGAGGPRLRMHLIGERCAGMIAAIAAGLICPADAISRAEGCGAGRGTFASTAAQTSGSIASPSRPPTPCPPLSAPPSASVAVRLINIRMRIARTTASQRAALPQHRHSAQSPRHLDRHLDTQSAWSSDHVRHTSISARGGDPEMRPPVLVAAASLLPADPLVVDQPWTTVSAGPVRPER